jgi:iron complex transport system substrate-binding protein
MKKNRLLLSLALVFSIALGACGSTPSEATELPAPEVDTVQSTATPAPAEPITLEDGLGRTITLAAPPQRIISLAPSNTETLFALGAGEQIVGRDTASDYPAEASGLEDIGDTFVGLNIDLILSLTPDLILAAEINPPEYITELENLGLTVFWLANPVDFQDLYTNIEIVGQITGRVAEAETLAVDLETRVAAVEDALANAAETPTVFYELDASDPALPWTAGFGTFIDELITQAGGTNIGGALEGSFAQFSIETLLQQDPDIILLGDAAYGVTPESLADRPGWGGLSAVQNNRVFPFNDNLASIPGPRLVDALEQLVLLIHPELFD